MVIESLNPPISTGSLEEPPRTNGPDATASSVSSVSAPLPLEAGDRKSVIQVGIALLTAALTLGALNSEGLIQWVADMTTHWNNDRLLQWAYQWHDWMNEISLNLIREALKRWMEDFQNWRI